MKIGFYVSRSATRLKKFLLNLKIENSNLINNVDFVITDNLADKDLENLCKDLKIDFFYLDLTNVKARNLYSSNYVYSIMQARASDYLFIYCDSIIKGEILNAFKYKIINFHPSLLPAHKGLFAIDQALQANSFLLGNTAHFVDSGIDTGPVIFQSIFPSVLFENYDQVLDLQIPMIKQLFYWLLENRISVENGKVIVKNAKYEVGVFIPNLEIN